MEANFLMDAVARLVTIIVFALSVSSVNGTTISDSTPTPQPNVIVCEGGCGGPPRPPACSQSITQGTGPGPCCRRGGC